jgi:predicted nucleic acid-binding protein
VQSYSSLIAEKSGLDEPDVQEIVELLFDAIGTVPSTLLSAALRKARTAITDEDPDDVPYLATAIAVDQAVIWSDDDDIFDEQKYVPWYPTHRILELYDNGVLDAQDPS